MLRIWKALLGDERIVRTIISSSEINTYPPLSFPGRIKVVKESDNENPEYLRRLLDIDSNQSAKPVLGIDTESKPSAFFSHSRNSTALIQLASANACILWRTIGPNRRRLPSFLISILEDPNIIKVGQGISNDISCLGMDFDNMTNEPRGLVDLYSIGSRLKCQPKSLQGMVGIFLRQRLLKDMQVSDWESESLRAEQVQYAAIDAWASRAVYMEMLKIYGQDIINEMGKVNSVENSPRTTPRASVTTPITLEAPVISPVSASVSPQIDLVKFCVRKGLHLKLGDFEKDGATNKFRCTFEVSTENGPIVGRSQDSHSSIRDAQADAAKHTLAQLVEN
jgi:ribonuclease D